MVFFATVGADRSYLFMIDPEGFFPPQDTGVIFGITEGAQDISFARCRSSSTSWTTSSPPIRTSQAIGSQIGAGVGGQTANNGRFYHRPQAVG